MRLLLLKQKSRSTVIFLPSAKKPHQHTHSSTAFPFSVFRSALPPHCFFISAFSRAYIIHFFTLSRRIWLPRIFFFPSFAYSLFHTPAFSRVLYIHFFFRCRKCFLLPSASPLSASCLSYPVFPIFFLPCLSASLLNDSFLPFLQQKQIR